MFEIVHFLLPLLLVENIQIVILVVFLLIRLHFPL